ncbi:MAG: hypothetical protein OIN66_10095 [Candidatus Methanoperedens sp.]|nr:hypothetical protein [Candidatus Methanoperedens sp.]
MVNKKTKLAILAVAIVILIVIAANYNLNNLRMQEGTKPPPATLTIDGEEQASGIGSYCWFEGNMIVCADYAGIPTIGKPLTANSSVTAHLRIPLNETPEELQINVFRVTDKDLINEDKGGLRFWKSSVGKYLTLPLENEQDVHLSLESGLYVLGVFPRWKEKGSVAYGFLLEVQ